MNEDQDLTLSLSSLLHPPIFSCFSLVRERFGGSIDNGTRFWGRRYQMARDKKGQLALYTATI
jgi:hypothetical protein